MLNRRQLLQTAGVTGAAALAGSCSSGGATTPASAPASGTSLSGQLSIVTPEFAGTEGKAVFEGSILKKFTEKHPGVTFQVDYVPWDKLNEKLSTQVAGGTASDLMMIGMGWTAPFAQKKLLAALDTSVLGGAEVPQLLLDNATYDGQLYSVPLLLESRAFVYRKDILGPKGITDLETDSIDAFTELLREVKSKTGLVPFDMLTSNLRQAWGLMTFAYGGRQFSDDGLTCYFDSDQAAKAMEWLVALQRDGLSDFNARVATGQPGPFIMGTSPIGWQNSGLWPTMIKQNPALAEEANLGLTLCPTLEASKKVIYQGGTLVGVSTRTKHRDACLAVTQYLVGVDALTEAARFTGRVPSNAKLATGTDLGGNRILDFSLKHLSSSVTDGGTPAWLEIRGKMDPICEAAVLGRTSVPDALSQLQKMAQEAIGRIR